MARLPCFMVEEYSTAHLKNFVYSWLCWLLAAVHGLFLVAVSGGYSSLQYTGFSFAVASLAGEHRL